MNIASKVNKFSLESEAALPAEKEKAEIPQPEPIPEPAPTQTVTAPHPGDMVYAEGFGWLKCQIPGQVTYAEDM